MNPMGDDDRWERLAPVRDLLAAVGRSSRSVAARWIESREHAQRCSQCGLFAVEPHDDMTGVQKLLCRACGHAFPAGRIAPAPVALERREQLLAKFDAEITLCRERERSLRAAGETARADEMAGRIERLLRARIF
jgi:hypothetical protein